MPRRICPVLVILLICWLEQRAHSQTLTIPLIPHHVVQQRRLEAGYTLGPSKHRPHRYLQKAQQVAALFQGYGTHYADVWCGSPPQRQTVIVDTGSGVTAFPCSQCKDCGVPDYHIDQLFDEGASSTYEVLSCDECLKGSCRNGGQCSIGMSYAEGSSWNAIEVRDLCYVGGLHDTPVKDDGNSEDLDPFHAEAFTFDMKFGCQNRVTGLFKTQLADGIMGMDVAQASFWWQMHDAGKIDKKVFSLCFSRHDIAEKDGTESGAMSLGGVDERLHTSDMVYTSSQESSGFYVVHVRKVYLKASDGDAQTLDLDERILNSGRVIVDSGTTDTYFSNRMGIPFKKLYKDITGNDYSHGVQKFTAEELAKEPTILFQLAGDTETNKKIAAESEAESIPGLAGVLDPENPYDVILAIPPEHYYEYDPDVEGYVARFYTEESSGGVLGANAMMGHDVMFDVENFRLGWAESSCDYTRLIKDNTDWEISANADRGPDESSRIAPGSSAHSDSISEDGSDGFDTDDGGEFIPEDEPSAPGSSSISDTPEDGKSEANNEPSGTYDYAEEASMCTGLGCQIAVMAGVLCSVVFAAVKMMRKRSTSGPAYEMADSELELQTTDGIFTNQCDDASAREFT